MTVKIIHPVSYELGLLKDKVEDLERQLAMCKAELSVAKTENVRLKDTIRRHGPIGGHRNATQPRSSSLTSSPRANSAARLSLPSSGSSTARSPASADRSKPSYMRPTKASFCKSKDSQLALVEQPYPEQKRLVLQPDFNLHEWAPPRKTRGWVSHYSYQDGGLVKNVVGFLKPTRASDKSGFALFTSKGTDEMKKSGHIWPIFESSPKWRRPRKSRYWQLQFTHQGPSQEFIDFLDLRLLPIRTRLDDDKWLEEMEEMHLEASKQYSLLQRGLDLAKQCLWDFLTNKKACCKYTSGWVTVRFGRNELLVQFGDDPSDSRVDDYFGYRGNSSWRVYSLLFDIVGLRNATCHFHVDTVEVIDRHLEHVQLLAVELYDEQRAIAVRALRDELRQEAEDVLDDMSALEPLSVLPFPEHTWEEHHETMLRLVDLYRFKEFPDAITRLAELARATLCGRPSEPVRKLEPCRTKAGSRVDGRDGGTRRRRCSAPEPGLGNWTARDGAPDRQGGPRSTQRRRLSTGNAPRPDPS